MTRFGSMLGLKRFEPGIDSRIDKNSYRFHFRLIDLSIQKKKIQSATPAREYAGYGAGGGWVACNLLPRYAVYFRTALQLPISNVDMDSEFRRFRSGLRSKVKVWCVGAFYSEKGCRSLQPLREGIQVFQQHVEPFKAPEDQSFGRLERRWARQSVHETYNFVGDLQR